MTNDYSNEAMIKSWIRGAFDDLGIDPHDRAVARVADFLRNIPVDQWEDEFPKNQIVKNLRSWKIQDDKFRKREEDLAELSSILSIAIAIFALSSALLAYLGFVLLPSATDVIEWLVHVSPYLITPLGVVAATILFACRGYLPKLYGTLEILVGIATVNATATSVNLQNVPTLLPFLGGIYVVIRGLDNLAKTLDAKTGLGKVFASMFNNPSKGKPDDRERHTTR
ncbi:hypothetical protein ELH91_18435 [Rhizobium leguminosarum]|uniref:hypothetical protein n=1 Tax=Rhizobium leguminosarum TaxID=384 RepID=UPI0010300118|nr:hypothetical protein [Rhizobium leguminosarum]TAY18624.1 hypothetical protein ELH91_18435 [Rhizobium leguminosarum]